MLWTANVIIKGTVVRRCNKSSLTKLLPGELMQYFHSCFCNIFLYFLSRISFALLLLQHLSLLFWKNIFTLTFAIYFFIFQEFLFKLVFSLLLLQYIFLYAPGVPVQISAIFSLLLLQFLSLPFLSLGISFPSI